MNATLAARADNRPETKMTSPTPVTPIHRGMTFGFYARNGYYGSKQARVEVDRMATLNINWVCVVVTVMQDTFASTRQYRDFVNTPADDELRDIIDYIHSKGMKVQLRPMLQGWDGSVRCYVHFPHESEIIPGLRMNHWTQWFDSMIARTLHYARLAERAGCEAYGLDSELDMTTEQDAHWKRVIAAARSVFSGHLTTGHTVYVDFLRELRARPDHWFKELDSVGTSFYGPLADPPADRPNMGHGAELYHMEGKAPAVDAAADSPEMQRWLEGPRNYFKEVARLLGKPFYFAECGCCSTAEAVRIPYRWDHPGGYDGAVQARYLESVLRAFWDEPWWMGMYWWKWDEQNDRPFLRDDPRGDKGLTVWGKPAAETMKRWYGRPDRLG